MKVGVAILYAWGCSRCGFNNEITFQPHDGRELPPCICGKIDVCGGITEEAAPDWYKKPKTPQRGRSNQ